MLVSPLRHFCAHAPLRLFEPALMPACLMPALRPAANVLKRAGCRFDIDTRAHIYAAHAACRRAAAAALFSRQIRGRYAVEAPREAASLREL